jgi:hypothetical protein
MSGDGGYAPDPVHQYGNVVMTISSRAGENDKQPPNTSALDSGGEPSNSSSARALRWNAEAFPVADETMVSNCLVEGGRQLIYLASQSLDCVQIVARIADDIACAKRFLSRVDQWASNHPDDLERQWSFVNGLINQWHHNAYIAQVKGADGELSAIELLECSLSLWAMREDLPQGSFWVFWIEGMRQALKELN